MTDKQIIINGVDVLKEKINMCFILLSHKLETSETIEQTIYDHLDVFVEEWNNQLKAKNIKISKTLIEIKEMCSEINCESLMQNSWCGNTDFKMGCCEKLFKKQILQKINECEVENERKENCN